MESYPSLESVSSTSMYVSELEGIDIIKVSCEVTTNNSVVLEDHPGVTVTSSKVLDDRLDEGSKVVLDSEAGEVEIMSEWVNSAGLAMSASLLGLKKLASVS